jgi:hypothetical protein
MFKFIQRIMGKKHEDYEFENLLYMNHNVKCNNYSNFLIMKFLNSFWIKFEFFCI